ncbi:choice-of-anchor I family protein [Thermosynechococcaceae cyanobacterium BACA0444]|uniref:Choice-of-anchor I family protein n=1 Tax=Pseudocalidococcus azoricus BACA0444 TaxID=2918990 RepID=A0AAE4JW40_9CYAN|nr:choice-of-anchor I family protein [Pseudocalidococcus azoricus]MDS3860651.1 choice-of-anchor I family protein [Pseudocalidococcus azoricus BACA0444]
MADALTKIGGYVSSSGAEIAAFDPGSDRLFVVAGDGVEIINLADPTNPSKTTDLALDTSTLPSGFNLVPNSVAVGKVGTISAGIVAVALAVRDTLNNQQAGEVQFFRASDGSFLGKESVGYLPDMVTFTPDGTRVLTANEGEPNETYTSDPEGSVSIIDISGGIATATVQNATFMAFNAQQASLEAAGIRIFGQIFNDAGEVVRDSTVAEDVESEYITFNGDGTKAWVTLQENNAFAVVDIVTATVEQIIPLGFKDHSLPGNGLDASDRDVDGSSGAGGKINIQNWPLLGMYQPDAIASYTLGGQTYYVTANEGDARIRPTDNEAALDLLGLEEGDIFNEEIRVRDVTLDPTAFPNAETLQGNINLGRINITNTQGDIDGDGDFDQLYSYGARSFSIWDSNGNLVFDSGDDFEQITAAAFPDFFNASNSNNTLDNRSDNKGPEPEGVTVGAVGGRNYAFIGLERIGGVMVYDVTDPTAPIFVQYLNNRDFTADPESGATDSGPEGLLFIPAADSPNGENLLVVTNEVSKTVSVMEFNPPPSPFTLQLLHVTDQEATTPNSNITNLSAVLNALENQDADGNGAADYTNTLRLSSGDAIIPGLFYDASGPVFGSRGIADIQIQNELGFHAIAFGNHEFDFGTAAIAGLISGSTPGSLFGADFTGTNFPYLSSNLDFSTDPSLAPLVVPGGQAPQANTVTSSVIIDVNGENIGVIGATTPTLASISSPGGLTITPSPFNSTPTDEQIAALAAEIQLEVDTLLEANPRLNKIVLLSHMQQIEIEFRLAQLLENVDIIVAGGSNTRLFDENDRIRPGDSHQGEYPRFIANAGGTQTAVVNTDGSYKYVGRLVIEFDAAGNIIPTSYDPTVSGAYATDAEGVAALNAEDLVDPEIQAIVEAIEAQIITTESNTLGIADVFLNGNRSGTGTSTDPDGIRTQETNLGNLTADANLAEAKKTDPTVIVSIKNGGGIRDSIGEIIVPPGGTAAVRGPNTELVDSEGNVIKPEGGISQTDVQSALAFNNDLVLLTLTKTELLAILEHGVAALPSANGRFPQIAGVKFSFDPDQEQGNQIQNAGIFDDEDNLVAELLRDGLLVGDPEETFRIVTLGFLAASNFDSNGNFIGGGDSYPFPNLNTDPTKGALGDPAVIERVNLVELDAAGIKTGNATFAIDGTEQDALAEYLLDNFATVDTAFDQADVGPELDDRIQNLNFRADTVFEGTAEIDLENSNEEKGVIALTSPLLLSFQAITTNTSFVNELVVFKVEDSQGRVANGDGSIVSPDDQGNYLAAILNANTTRVVLSSLNSSDDLPNDFLSAFGNLEGLSSELLLDSAARLGFMLVVGGTLDDLRAGKDRDVLLSTQDEAQLTDLSNNEFSLVFGEGGSSSNDLIFNVSTSNFDNTINLANEADRVGRNVAINGATIEAIDLVNLNFDTNGDGIADDLTGRTANVGLTFYREAAYDNLIGFYIADAVTGAVNGVLPTGDPLAYAQAAFDNAVASFNAPLNESKLDISLQNLAFGNLILPFIISNGTTPNADFSNMYIPFLSLNQDGIDHIRLLGSGVFGFEDLPGGGDQDFDDIIAQITTVTVNP